MVRAERIDSKKVYEAFRHNPKDPIAAAAMVDIIQKYVALWIKDDDIKLLDAQYQNDLIYDIYGQLAGLASVQQLPNVNVSQTLTRIYKTHLPKYIARKKEETFSLDSDLVVDDQEELILDSVFAEWLISQAKNLTRREKIALLYFVQDATHKEIAKALGEDSGFTPSRERVRQICVQMIRKIKYKVKNMDKQEWQLVLSKPVEKVVPVAAEVEAVEGPKEEQIPTFKELLESKPEPSNWEIAEKAVGDALRWFADILFGNEDNE